MLPIGSVVYLKEGTQKVMILSRAPLVTTDEGEQLMFDYAGCMYPSGLEPDNVLYFNKENIDQIVFEGHRDEQEERWQQLYKRWLEENESKIKRGKVTEAIEPN